MTGDQSWQLLRASLAVGGRSLILYEEGHPRARLGNRKAQQQFLERPQRMLPLAVTPIVVAVSGFRTPFFRSVKRFCWHWLGRIRSRDLWLSPIIPRNRYAQNCYKLNHPQTEAIGRGPLDEE